MYVVSVENVEEKRVTLEGASGVRVKYLLHSGVGAERVQLRLFTLDVGGYTPLETHSHEHEVFILEGRALVRGGGEEVVVKPGDVIFIPSCEQHQFTNIGDEPLVFLCTKETL